MKADRGRQPRARVDESPNSSETAETGGLRMATVHQLRPAAAPATAALPFAPIGRDEASRALDTLLLAFTGDPVERWLYPEAQQYLAHFPKFLSAFAGRAFEERTAWKLGEFAAVALWLPPGSDPDGDAIAAVLAETVPPNKHKDTFSVLEQMDATHPRAPQWYLPLFGVDTPLQGRGLGAQLMKHCLRIVDASHQPAYLEAPNPRTVPFYERFGFRVIGVAQAGTCPPVAMMHRAAAPRA